MKIFNEQTESITESKKFDEVVNNITIYNVVAFFFPLIGIILSAILLNADKEKSKSVERSTSIGFMIVVIVFFVTIFVKFI